MTAGSLSDALPPPLRRWAAAQAERMDLPGPDDFVLLLVRLEKQRLDLESVASTPSPEHGAAAAALHRREDALPVGG